MNTDDFDFNLPENLIAQERVQPYDHSKLMILNKKTGAIEDRHFYDITSYLSENDVLVFNNTKVFKARMYGKKKTGGRIEILLLEPIIENIFQYKCITKGSIKEGDEIFLSSNLNARILKLFEDGGRIIEFNFKGDSLREEIEKISEFPLPPYIHRQENPQYQTVYAKDNEQKSIAAPTAGFHFTNRLLEEIKSKGIIIENISLNIGLGTFVPVKSEKIEEHKMHREYYHIDDNARERLNRYKKEGKRIIAIGTTSVRTLEDSSNEKGTLEKQENNTDIFIYPSYQFKFVDAMVTNFHLPKSTLIMLVSAFAGRENILNAYKYAVEHKYRFFSFGDAMFIS